jgi:hypothetical protein
MFDAAGHKMFNQRRDVAVAKKLDATAGGRR